MKDYTMDQYTLQSYFKSMCNSFCIARKQVKRLEEKKKEVQALYPEDEEKCKELEYPIRFWSDKLWNESDRIEGTIKTMISKEYTIIVTTEEEIIALMNFFNIHLVARYAVINTNEDAIKDFPQGKEMYAEFLAAYDMDVLEARAGTAILDNANINEVIKKYF